MGEVDAERVRDLPQLGHQDAACTPFRTRAPRGPPPRRRRGRRRGSSIARRIRTTTTRGRGRGSRGRPARRPRPGRGRRRSSIASAIGTTRPRRLERGGRPDGRRGPWRPQAGSSRRTGAPAHREPDARPGGASIIRSHSRTDRAIGFSTSTCYPPEELHRHRCMQVVGTASRTASARRSPRDDRTHSIGRRARTRAGRACPGPAVDQQREAEVARRGEIGRADDARRSAAADHGKLGSCVSAGTAGGSIEHETR